jgi:polar amino acid transport system substrate-binding protein
VVAVLWMFASILFIAFYTAQLTATLTMQQIQGSISGPGDLQGRKIATTTGSTAATFLREQKALVQEHEQIETPIGRC